MALAIAAPAWAPACMDADEWALWERANRSINSSIERATRPCADCPLGYAADMRADDRCNGTPGGVQDEEEADAVEAPAEPRAIVAPAITERREDTGREGDMDRTGPTELQGQAWDLVTKAGMTQVQAAAHLGISQGGLQSRLRGYQKATGISGPLPGLLGSTPRFVPVPAEVLDGPTTSAPAPLVPATVASPSSVDRDPTDEPIAAPAPADPSPGAGSGDPSAEVATLASASAGHSPEADGTGGMVPSADRGVDLIAVNALGVLEHECKRLADQCRALDEQVRELMARQAALADLHEAAIQARDAYRAFVGIAA